MEPLPEINRELPRSSVGSPSEERLQTVQRTLTAIRNEYLSATILLEQLPEASDQIAAHLLRGWQLLISLRTTPELFPVEGAQPGAAKPVPELPGLREGMTGQVYRFLESGAGQELQPTPESRGQQVAWSPSLSDLEALTGALDVSYRAVRHTFLLMTPDADGKRLLRRRVLLEVAVGIAALTGLFVLGAFLAGSLDPGEWFQVQREGFTIIRARQDWGALQIDRTVEGKPFVVGGERFAKGIGTHAFSQIRLKVNDGMTVLSGACGVDDETAGKGSVTFVIEQSGKILFESGVVRGGDAPRPFRVRVAPQLPVELLVKDGGDGYQYDHANWLNLKVERGE